MTEPASAPGLVVVMGGTGFLGSAITRALLRRATPVAVVSRRPANVARRFPGLQVEARRGDVTSPPTLTAAVSGAHTVVQCVQFPGFPVEDRRRGRTFMAVDAEGTKAVVAAGVAAGARKIVYLSGVGADPDSSRPWFRAKGIAEAAVAASGMIPVVLRPSWVYGPGDASLNRFIEIIQRVPFAFPQLGSGRSRLTPVFIDDVAELAADAILGAAADGLTLEIGGPEVLTMDDIVRAAMRAVGREKRILHVPLSLVKLAAAVLERLPGQILSPGAVDFITGSAVANPDVTLRVFPEFRPRTLEAALRTYLRAE